MTEMSGQVSNSKMRPDRDTFQDYVGKKAAEGRLELVTRSSATSQDVPIGEIVQRVQELVYPDLVNQEAV